MRLRQTLVAVKALYLFFGCEGKMAGDGEIHGDLKAHSESYVRFIWWLKVSMIGSALLTALVIFLITR